MEAAGGDSRGPRQLQGRAACSSREPSARALTSERGQPYCMWWGRPPGPEKGPRRRWKPPPPLLFWPLIPLLLLSALLWPAWEIEAACDDVGEQRLYKPEEPSRAYRLLRPPRNAGAPCLFQYVQTTKWKDSFLARPCSPCNKGQGSVDDGYSRCSKECVRIQQKPDLVSDTIMLVRCISCSIRAGVPLPFCVDSIFPKG